MDVREWHRAWIGTIITLNVAATFAWLATMAVAREAAMPTTAGR